MPGVNVTNAASFYKILASSVGRASVFIKLEVAGSKLIFFSFFSHFFFFFFFFYIYIYNYCHSRLLQGGL